MKLADIDWAVCAKFSITREQILGRDKRRAICYPRFVAMLLAREMTGYSLPQIGRHYGRDHSTVYVGIRRIRNAAATNDQLATWISECRAAAILASQNSAAVNAANVQRLHQGIVSWPVDQPRIEA
jgi:chromosomal replication initiator protein